MTLRAGSTGDDVTELQTQLQQGGYYSGPIDGDYGPDTEAAVRAYQTAHGLTVDGVAGAETWGNIHGDPNYPNNTTGTLGGGGNSSSPSSSDIDAVIRSKVPALAYLLDTNPEVATILREAYSTNPPMDADIVQGKIMQTSWWKTNSDTARDYYTLQNTDPATFQRELWEMKDQVRSIGGQLGYDETVLDEGYLDSFANRALKSKMTPAEIRAMLANEITPLIGTTEKSPILAQLREVQQAFDYVVDTPTLNYWLKAIGNGTQTIDNFKLSIISQMKSLYPHLGNSFDEGMTFDQITRPYRTQIAQLLELDPNTIDFGNPDWRHVVDYVDPKDGTHRSMSNQELSRYVKSRDEYWHTRGGKDEAGEFAEGILQDFGMVKR